MIVSLFLSAMNMAADNLVHKSTRCKICLPWYIFRSIATTSWNSLAIGNPTLGRGGGFLKTLQTSQLLVTSLISLFKLSLRDQVSPALLIRVSAVYRQMDVQSIDEV
jgi:hypothetical protein